ncbi:IclR family transcriptional regulator [Novosphingobium sp. JCM 18896]|uniref:IclR family transcriptional regulator n=1 Tax=Novosphingobium sp. JCM 18896 TaxID=2989731 RepID=UPI002221373E|nr:helix-turn-helix domain-containing protein [Novosphingobium sp. JCM 18896]MCW1431222.1 helix-turn-helix domain-containing protein [Novosphingobium sp. JCM 18896]
MSQASPAVRRVIAVLNFFADHPGSAFTLTDVSRALKISQATTHGLLAGLVEGGYLYRLSDKRYLPGPALVAIGETAREHFSPLRVVQPEMRLLADRYDAICTAAFREHDDVIVRARAAALSHLGIAHPRNERLPLLPQFAALFFAWASPDERAAWLDQLSPAPTAAQCEAMDRGVDFIQRHGFMLAVRNPASTTNDESSRWIFEQRHTNAPMVPATEIEAQASYEVGFIQVPVRGVAREVAFVVGLTGIPGQVSGAQVIEIGETIRAACERVAGFLTRSTT